MSQTDVVQRLCRFIDARADQRLTLQMLAVEADLSPFHLQRIFRAALGVSPRQYQEARRLQLFTQALGQGGTVADATYAAGFGSSSRLYDAARQLGLRPAAYRNKGTGLTIHFSVFRAALGAVLVAATERGLCRVALGDLASDLEQQLQDEFARAVLARDDAVLAPYVDSLKRYLHGQSQALDLPLDIRATAFQRRVWQLLQQIPYGQTRSYSQLASQLGSPNAVRAVANACASNPVALVIPCHRVVQKDGKLAGYRWGLARKAALLKQESLKVPAKPDDTE